MHRYFRMLAVAVVVSLSFAATGAGPAAIRDAAAAGCPAGQDQAWVTLHSTMTWRHYVEMYSGGGRTTNEGMLTIESVHAGKITYTLCVAHSASKGWTIRKAPDVVPHDYHGMDSSLHVTDGTGFALTPRRVNAKSLTVEPTICRSRGGGLDFVKFVAGLPVPGVTYAVSVGIWIGGKLVPAGRKSCQSFGDMTIPISFKSSNGNTTPGIVSEKFLEKRQIKTGDCLVPPNGCWDINEFSWRVYP